MFTFLVDGECYVLALAIFSVERGGLISLLSEAAGIAVGGIAS